MMDEFDEGIDSGLEAGSNSKVGIFGIGIGIIGIIVGITGIVMANMAQKQVDTLEAKIASHPDRTPELQDAIEDMEERLVKLGSEFVKLGRQDRQIQENTQAAFDSVLRDIKANREGLNQVTGKMTELVEKIENWRPAAGPMRPASPSTSSDGDGTPEAGATPPDSGIYTVQSGDTLSSIAKRFGVSLSAIQAANPTVNPRAMRIGQKIVIPE